MIYSLVYSDLARKQLKKLPRNVQERVLASLEKCRIRPYSYVLRLVGRSCFRLRVGDYRVIVDVIDDKLMILVIEVEHRSKVYD